MKPQISFSNKMLLLASFAVAACAGPSTVPVAAEPDLVGTRIAQAAEKASQALDALSGIEQQRTPIITQAEDLSAAPANLTQPVTVRWSGPIEQISQTLATRAGLRYVTRGSQPPVPITVAVDVYQQPLIEVLKSIGLQAGRRADLNVDGNAGVLEIRYAPVDRL